MAKWTRLLVATLLGLFIAAGASFGQTSADAAANWGLLGTWRLDCSTEVSRNDPDLNFVVRDGQLFHDRNWGNGSDSSAVIAASITPDGGFSVTVRFESLKQTRQWGYVKQGDGRIRVMFNRNVDNDQYSIRDGKLTANGNPTAWQTRCR
jgi:hypothetical protein